MSSNESPNFLHIATLWFISITCQKIYTFADVHFIDEVGAHMTIHRPLSQEWKMMLALWTNYDIDQKRARFEATNSWKKVYWFIEDSLNENLPPGVERRTSLQWWWTFDSSLVSLASDTECAFAEKLPGSTVIDISLGFSVFHRLKLFKNPKNVQCR